MAIHFILEKASDLKVNCKVVVNGIIGRVKSIADKWCSVYIEGELKNFPIEQVEMIYVEHRLNQSRTRIPLESSQYEDIFPSIQKDQATLHIYR